MEIFESSKLVLFIIFAIPGFISIKTYSLLCPNQDKDSTKLIIDAITYSCLNYALLGPLIYMMLFSNKWEFICSFFTFLLLVNSLLSIYLINGARRRLDAPSRQVRLRTVVQKTLGLKTLASTHCNEHLQELSNGPSRPGMGLDHRHRLGCRPADGVPGCRAVRP